MTLALIAQRLNMGTRTHLVHRCIDSVGTSEKHNTIDRPLCRPLRDPPKSLCETISATSSRLLSDQSSSPHESNVMSQFVAQGYALQSICLRILGQL